MKNTKTTIRELSARYRDILKKCFFLNAVALGLFAATSASAASNAITALNDFNMVSGYGTVVTGSFLQASDITDMATKTWVADQHYVTMADVKNSLDMDEPIGTNYAYKAPDGTSVTLNKDGTTATGASLTDYVGTSAVDGTKVTTTQTIAHDAAQSKSNYSFASTAFALDGSGAFQFDSEGNVVVDDVHTSTVYSDTAPDHLSGKYTLSNKAFTSDPTTVTITSASGAPAIDASTYDVSITGTRYHLSADGTKLLDETDNNVTAAFPEQYATLKATYDNDVTRVATAKSAVDTAYSTNGTNYGATTTAYTTDGQTITALTNNYATLMDPSSGAKTSFDHDKSLYDNSLGPVIDEKADAAVVRGLAEGGAIRTAVTAGITDLITTKEGLLSQDIGYNLADPDNETTGLVARLEALTDESTDKTLVGAINANTGAIALKANAADVYTKAEAEAIFYEKQQWVDDTLGIESSKKDAVKTAYSGTNYLTTTTTLTGADIVLDGQIKTINNTLGEGFDTGDNTVAKVITAKANAAESNAKEYAKGYTDTVVAGLDAELSQAAGTDGLALSITEVDGKITAISGSIAANTYDAYGAATTAEANAKDYTDESIKALAKDTSDTFDDVVGTTGELADLESLSFFKAKNSGSVGGTAPGDSSVAELLTNLNGNLETEFARVDSRINKLETKLEKGLAANNALAGLVPLDHVHRTQVSAALGGYKNNQALAVGAFHYINDRTLLNAGAAYGGNDSVSYKVGVTFGF